LEDDLNLSTVANSPQSTQVADFPKDTSDIKRPDVRWRSHRVQASGSTALLLFMVTHRII